MMNIMIRVIIGSLMMKTNFLNGTMAVKNERPRKHKLKKISFQLLGIHQDIGIGACQETRKKTQKIFGHKYEPFCMW